MGRGSCSRIRARSAGHRSAVGTARERKSHHRRNRMEEEIAAVRRTRTGKEIASVRRTRTGKEIASIRRNRRGNHKKLRCKKKNLKNLFRSDTQQFKRQTKNRAKKYAKNDAKNDPKNHESQVKYVTRTPDGRRTDGHNLFETLHFITRALRARNKD